MPKRIAALPDSEQHTVVTTEHPHGYRPKPLSLYCRRGWLLALSPLALPVLMGSAHAESWRCIPNAEGTDWNCVAKVVDQTTQTGVQQQRSGSSLDWVPEAALSAEQRKLMQPHCCGAYIAPTRTDPEANLNPELAPMRASADRSQWENQVIATLDGNVQVWSSITS